jgi:general secretion pathway protein G
MFNSQCIAYTGITLSVVLMGCDSDTRTVEITSPDGWKITATGEAPCSDDSQWWAKLTGKDKPSCSHLAGVQVENFSATLDLYRLEIGRYPTSQEGLDALVRNPGSSGWKGPYLKSSFIPRTPWGGAYYYEAPFKDQPYAVWHLGRDDRIGGDGPNRDYCSASFDTVCP